MSTRINDTYIKSFHFDIKENEKDKNNVFNISFKHDIILEGIKIRTGNNCQGDILNINIGPKLFLGVLTQNTNPSENKLYVDMNVCKYLKLGQQIIINDTQNEYNLGKCIHIDYKENSILTEKIYSQSIPFNSKLLRTINMVEDYVIFDNQETNIFDETIYNFIPKMINIQINYNSKNDDNDKILVLDLKYSIPIPMMHQI